MDMLAYSRIMGFIVAVLSWFTLFMLIMTWREHNITSARWLIMAWLLHVAIFFTTTRIAREFFTPIPVYISNMWSMVLYLQALISVLAYLYLWRRYPH